MAIDMPTTVLWVDDDSAKLRVVEDLLEGLHVEFIHANSVEDALSKLGDAKHVPVLLLDAILAPPRDPGLMRLLEEPNGRNLDAQASNGPSVGRDADAPLERIFQTSYENLERGGQLFQQICRIKGIKFDKTIMISYVKENILKDIGYLFDRYISKLDLFDKLGFLRDEIESAVNSAASKK
jgi:CheY-like chemotaxis protein